MIFLINLSENFQGPKYQNMQLFVQFLISIELYIFHLSLTMLATRCEVITIIIMRANFIFGISTQLSKLIYCLTINKAI